MTNTPTPQELANWMTAPFVQAGRLLLELQASGLAVSSKADGSPVTVADRQAEDILTAALVQIAPSIPILAEETASNHQDDADTDLLFLVDALDGTRGYCTGGNEFTLNVGLLKDGEPIFGMVLDPCARKLYATVGPLALIEADVDFTAPTTALSDLPHRRVASRPPPADEILAVVSRSTVTAAEQQYLRNCDRPVSLRPTNSSLKFCILARGEADIYPRSGPTHAWDTCAGHAVLLAAGGCVTTLDGKPFRYTQSLKAPYLNTSFVAWARPEIMRACGITSV